MVLGVVIIRGSVHVAGNKRRYIRLEEESANAIVNDEQLRPQFFRSSYLKFLKTSQRCLRVSREPLVCVTAVSEQRIGTLIHGCKLLACLGDLQVVQTKTLLIAISVLKYKTPHPFAYSGGVLRPLA